MNPEQMRRAFTQISAEAGNDESLKRAIASRCGERQFNIPIKELKALFRQFMVVILPALALSLILSLVNIKIAVTLPGIDTLEMQQSTLPWINLDALTNSGLLILWFFRGALRGYLFLAVFSFMLTAAAMPVHRSYENSGGLPCADC